MCCQESGVRSVYFLIKKVHPAPDNLLSKYRIIRRNLTMVDKNALIEAEFQQEHRGTPKKTKRKSSGKPSVLGVAGSKLEDAFETFHSNKELQSGLIILFQSLLCVGFLVIVYIAICGVPNGLRSSGNLKGRLFRKEQSVCKLVAKSKDLRDISRSDRSSPCAGMCYLKRRNILVPCATSFSNGCNTCQYDMNGGLSCTKKTCNIGCYHEGFYFRPGDVVPRASGDSCNTCRCQQVDAYQQGNQRYEIRCTKKNCKTCWHRGSAYKYGKSWTDLCPANNSQYDDDAVNNDDDESNNVYYQNDDANNNDYYDSASNDDGNADANDDDDDHVENICTCYSDGNVNCTNDWIALEEEMATNNDDYVVYGWVQNEETGEWIYNRDPNEAYYYDQWKVEQGQYGYYEYKKYYSQYSQQLYEQYGAQYESNEENYDPYPYYCPDQKHCVWEGRAYGLNTCFKSRDGKNQCACLPSGKVACTVCELY